MYNESGDNRTTAINKNIAIKIRVHASYLDIVVNYCIREKVLIYNTDKLVNFTLISLAMNDLPDPGGPRRIKAILAALILRPGNSMRSVNSVGSGTVIKSFMVGADKSIARDLEQKLSSSLRLI